MTKKYDLNEDDWSELATQWENTGYPAEAEACKGAASIVSQKPVYVVLCSTRQEGASWGVSRNLGLDQCLPASSIEECKNFLRLQPYIIVRLDSWTGVSDFAKREVEDYVSTETRWLDVDAALDLKRLIAHQPE